MEARALAKSAAAVPCSRPQLHGLQLGVLKMDDETRAGPRAAPRAAVWNRPFSRPSSSAFNQATQAALSASDAFSGVNLARPVSAQKSRHQFFAVLVEDFLSTAHTVNHPLAGPDFFGSGLVEVVEPGPFCLASASASFSRRLARSSAGGRRCAAAARSSARYGRGSRRSAYQVLIQPQPLPTIGGNNSTFRTEDKTMATSCGDPRHDYFPDVAAGDGEDPFLRDHDAGLLRQLARGVCDTCAYSSATRTSPATATAARPRPESSGSSIRAT